MAARPLSKSEGVSTDVSVGESFEVGTRTANSAVVELAAGSVIVIVVHELVDPVIVTGVTAVP